MALLDRYRQTSLDTLGPAARVREALLAILRQVEVARRAMAERDIPGAHNALAAAQRGVLILQGALVDEAAPELTARLRTLYQTALAALADANVRKDPAPLDTVQAVLTPLAEAWSELASAAGEERRESR